MNHLPHVREAIRLRRRLVLGLWTIAALRVTAAWAFLCGALAGAWRLWQGELATVPLPALAAAAGVLALAVAAAGGAARRRAPPLARLVALLDAVNRAGGLATAEADGADLAGWPMPALGQRPAVLLTWRPAARLLAAAGAFLLGCACLPVPAAAVAARQRLQAEQTVAALAERLAVLAEEDLLPDPELSHWQEQLRRIGADASGQDPVRTWEALDYLDEALRNRATDALHKTQDWNTAMQAAADALAVMQELAAHGAMDPAEQARALAALAANLQAAAERAGVALPPEIAGAIDRLLEGQDPLALTPEQLQRLAAALRQAQQGLAQSLENVSRLRLLSPEELQRMLENLETGSACGGDPRELALALLDLPCAQPGAGGVSAESLLAACDNGQPGRGAVSRGRGDAELTWCGNTQPGGEAFRPEALPPGSLLDLAQSQLQGISYAPAQETDVTTPAGTGALDGAGGGATRATAGQVLPRHRSAVERYFERGN